ncbi:MAG: tagaturonate epimerase family protein [Treponema sp.]|nr:tagaturonate epimerase family protein [Treponema sp.]
MNYLGINAYEKSIHNTGSDAVFMAEDDGRTVIVVASSDGKAVDTHGFNGRDSGDGKFRAPLTHENACALRKLFPFTAPVCGLSKPRSFGLGDRLGIATPGHIDLFMNKDVFPIFAQQSIRELNLTGRTYEDVLDAATFAVFREGYTKGFGADGDHLKTAKDVEYALSLGFTMITLDCSDHIKNDVTESNAPAVSKQYADKYLHTQFDIEDGIRLAFTDAQLRQCVAIYGEAIQFAADMYKRFLASGKYSADFEISIDETVSVTTPLQHFFVARELLDSGVRFATIAPRFCGEFQKGVDYRGDIAQFEKEIKVHAAIARRLGYKLSIHSGSDKFSVFPIIGRETRGCFHVKTAGTNWLEAMRVVSLADPSLYREIHRYALTAFGEASKYYHVTTDLAKIPDISALADSELPKLFENDDARQLIHITYGLILGKKNSGSGQNTEPGQNAGAAGNGFTFRGRLYKLWKEHDAEYRSALVRHIGKHLELLGV